MRREGSLYRRGLFVASLLCLAACVAACTSGSDNPTQARAGTWRGETAFGSFSFTICEGGRKITAYKLEYTAGESKMLSMGRDDEIVIDKDGSFELGTSEAGVVFQGRFSEDGKSARGVWEITPTGAAAPVGGDTVSEDWALDR